MDLLGSEVDDKFKQLRQIATLLREAQFASAALSAASATSSASTAVYSGGGGHSAAAAGGGGGGLHRDHHNTSGSTYTSSHGHCTANTSGSHTRDPSGGGAGASSYFVPYIQRMPAYLTTTTTTTSVGVAPPTTTTASHTHDNASNVLFPSLKQLPMPIPCTTAAAATASTGGSNHTNANTAAATGAATSTATSSPSSAAAAAPLPLLDTTTRVHDAAVVFNLEHNPLLLSKQPAEATTLLRLHSLGDALEELLQELQRGVERSLVDFYKHVKGKEEAEARVMPQLQPGQLPPRSPTGTHAAGAGGGGEDQPFSLVRALPPDTAGTAAAADEQAVPTNGVSSRSAANASNNNTNSNAQQAERRLAATQLQYIIHMLLEAALTGTDSTTAALYLTDTTAAGGGGTSLAPCSGTRNHHHNTMKDKNTALPTASAATTATSAPRFLQRVAHFDGDDKFPVQISCASHHPVVLVAQSGVAANLSHVQRERGPTAAAGSSSGDDAHGSSYAARWDIRNAIVVPLTTGFGRQGGAAGATAATTATTTTSSSQGGTVAALSASTAALQGCLVLADKRLSLLSLDDEAAATNKGFTVEDEHLAWGTARLLSALLRRYDAQQLLLLTQGYNPGLKVSGSGAAALHKYMRYNPIPVQRAMLLSSGGPPDLKAATLTATGGGAAKDKDGTSGGLLFTSKAAQKVYALMERAAVGAPEDHEGHCFHPSSSPSVSVGAAGATRSGGGGALKRTNNNTTNMNNIYQNAVPLLNSKLRIVRCGDPSAAALRLRAQLAAPPPPAAAAPAAAAATTVTTTTGASVISFPGERFALATPAAGGGSKADAQGTCTPPAPPPSTTTTTTTAAAGTAELREEDVFETAAHYVGQLETLWQNSLQDQTRMTDVVASYEAQLDQQRALITALEVKLRSATAAAAEAGTTGGAARGKSGGGAHASGGAHDKKKKKNPSQ